MGRRLMVKIIVAIIVISMIIPLISYFALGM